ncbi:protein CXorf21 [Colossoma macropomum]|uniref:protein CXorf21 n=1 Tax=Colossoma macropomum TaxID=42526 RepID=UPI001864C417|nr:protein CXorf21 [Colossoma macropomum]
MLGEAFLHVLKYTQEGPEHTACRDQNTHLQATPPPETTMTQLTFKSPLTPRALRAARPEGREKPGHCLTSTPSMALSIPTCSVENHWEMEHYISGSCPSICKAYPDLQLAGDTLRGPHHLHNPAHLISQSHGPLLQSQDLGSLEAFNETGQEVDCPAKPDEGYLVIESIQGPGSEPRLTNSMLNGYLETQLMEVYRQHMQDSLARCASSSLTASVVPALVHANLSKSHGHKAIQEDGLNSSSSQDSLRYLSTCSAPPTSHFSSPVLRISYPQEPKS